MFCQCYLQSLALWVLADYGLWGAPPAGSRVPAGRTNSYLFHEFLPRGLDCKVAGFFVVVVAVVYLFIFFRIRQLLSLGSLSYSFYWLQAIATSLYPSSLEQLKAFPWSLGYDSAFCFPDHTYTFVTTSLIKHSPITSSIFHLLTARTLLICNTQ